MTTFDRARRHGIAPLGALIAGLALAGCVSTTHVASAPVPRFDAVAFFAGRSEGKGVLKIALHRPATTLVEGNGRVTDDGSIVLDQTVRRQGKPATQRQWVLHPVGTDRYTGTLSDAVGPVDGRVDGSVLHLRFAMKGGLQAEQFLALQPGGTVAQNVMIVRKLGVAVARLDETITRLGR